MWNPAAAANNAAVVINTRHLRLMRQTSSTWKPHRLRTLKSYISPNATQQSVRIVPVWWMPEPCTSCTLWYVSDVVMNVRLCLSPGALHQSECEEERLPEHTESGRPAQRVLHHLLRRKQTHTHSSTLLLLPSDGHTPCICARVNTSSFFNAHAHTRAPTRTVLVLSPCERNVGNWDGRTDVVVFVDVCVFDYWSARTVLVPVV